MYLSDLVDSTREAPMEVEEKDDLPALLFVAMNDGECNEVDGAALECLDDACWCWQYCLPQLILLDTIAM